MPKTDAGRSGDILLDSPMARHAEVVPAIEDRSYLSFIAGAMASAILGGFVLAVILSLSQAGVLLPQFGRRRLKGIALLNLHAHVLVKKRGK